MNAAGLAALIAAVFWALLVCVGVFVLLRLGRFLSESSKLVADVRERGDVLLTRAQAAVDGAQAAGCHVSLGPLAAFFHGSARSWAWGLAGAGGLVVFSGPARPETPSRTP